MTLETSGQRLPIAYELRIAEETSEIFQELLTRLDRLPSSIELYAFAYAQRRLSESLFSIQKRIEVDLRNMWGLLSEAQCEAEKLSGRVGDKPRYARDRLVRQVIAEVSRRTSSNSTKKRVAEVALALLTACEVPVPADLPDFQKLARKVGKD